MPENDYVLINFSISAAAWSEIDNIRDFYDRNSTDKADIPAIAWGTTMRNDGKSWDGVFVAFYRQSERSEISGYIQYIDGRELIFMANEVTEKIFSGKVVNFDIRKGFYLSSM